MANQNDQHNFSSPWFDYAIFEENKARNFISGLLRTLCDRSEGWKSRALGEKSV